MVSSRNFRAYYAFANSQYRECLYDTPVASWIKLASPRDIQRGHIIMREMQGREVKQRN